MGGALHFLLVLGVLVGVHEAGHFLACVACRVRILEVGLGLPPRLARLASLRGTALSLNLLPLGGFVLPDGEFDPSRASGFAAAAPLRRAAILAAGPAANLMLAFALFMLAFVSGAPDSVRVVAVEPRSPAEQAGLRAGDLVLRVDGKPVRSADGLHAVVSSGLGRRLELTILRDERETILSLTPRTGWSPDGRAAGFDSTGVLVRYPLGAAGLRAAQSIGDQLRAVPGSWPSGTDGAGRIQMAGLVGMKRLSDRAFENSRNWGEPFPVLFVAASLSLALGVTNLLPLPALDGGRLALVLSEWVFRRRIAVRLEQRIHAVGFGLLVAGMIALAIHDSVQPPL